MYLDNAASAAAATPALLAAPLAATLVIDETLQVLSADEAGRAALADETTIRLALGRLCTGNHTSNARLREAVTSGQPSADLRIACADGRSLVVSVMPIASLGDAMRVRQAVLILRSEAIAVDAIANVAGECRLTGAETEVLRLIYKGLNTVEVSGAMGVAKTTVRTHLKHIFEKTETSRQSELVHFVATYAPA